MSYGKFKTIAEVAIKFDIEAKKDNFDEGWTQVLAEMVATSLFDDTTTCYGVVTTGAIWQFGKLEKNVFIIDPNYLSATSELQRVFNTLNWICDTLSKQ